MRKRMQKPDENFEFPALQTERLMLRPLLPSDVDFVYRHFSSKAVNQYLKDEEPVQTVEQAQAIVDFYQVKGKLYNRWVLERKEDGQQIGTCGFHRWNLSCSRAEVGYDLGEAFWGQGYMQEAMKAALRFGFEEMGLNRIEAFVDVENMPSLKVLKRMGFQREGVLREYYYLHGKYFDTVLQSLLKSDWAERNG